jgi:RNA polymerase sigma-70 factor (ECF subfamily)
MELHVNTVHKFVAVKIGPENVDVDDIVQETLIGAVSSVARLRGVSRPLVAAWLLSIARHKIADHLRARYRDRDRHHELDAGLADPAPPVDEVVVQADRAERVRLALGLLTPEQEEVLVLRFVLGFGLQDVADMTRRPLGAVKSMQHRGLATLHQRLSEEEPAWR